MKTSISALVFACVVLVSALAACSEGCSARISLVQNGEPTAFRDQLLQALGQLAFRETPIPDSPKLAKFSSERVPFYSVIFPKEEESPTLTIYFGIGGVSQCSPDGIQLFRDLRAKLQDVFGKERVAADNSTNTGQRLD